MIIGNINLDEQVFVIAEIGNNHEGNFSLAKEMVELAAESGVDAVKFQTIVPELLIQSNDKDRIEQLRRYQLTYEQFEKLSKHAEKAGVTFLSTPFDLESASFLNSIQPAFKIASGDNTFFPLIETVAGFAKPMLVSTGFTDIEEIRIIYERVEGVWKRKNVSPGLAFLHCVASYPTPKAQANLGAINTLRNSFPKVTIGYSDHTLGIDAAVYSVAAGARIVEKHFTIDKNYSNFRDHQLSADPDELRSMVSRIREVSEMIGPGVKATLPCETSIKKSARRSIVAAMDLPAGTVLTAEHLNWVRPGIGLAPGTEAQLYGKKVNRPFSKGELIDLSDFE